MKTTHTLGVALGAVALGVGRLGAGYAAREAATQDPAYTSSIQAKDHGREERGVKTAANEIKDVKADAGNATVLHVGPGGSEEDED